MAKPGEGRFYTSLSTRGGFIYNPKNEPLVMFSPRSGTFTPVEEDAIAHIVDLLNQEQAWASAGLSMPIPVADAKLVTQPFDAKRELDWGLFQQGLSKVGNWNELDEETKKHALALGKVAFDAGWKAREDA